MTCAALSFRAIRSTRMATHYGLPTAPDEFSDFKGERHLMLKQATKRLRDRTVVTAAILSLIGGNGYAAGNGPIGGAHSNDGKTESPIKHVIVIIGENRTFDHIFATYEPREGEHVDNLLSKGIIKEDGSPGPNYAKAAQFAAKDNNFYTINPDNKTAYNKTNNKLQAPGTSYAP